MEEPSDDPRRLRAVPNGPADPGGGAADLADLLRRSGRGDEAAFAMLYDALAPRIYGLVLRVVRDPSQSEEVTQEVFVEIWRQSARFDPAIGSPLSWMMTIAHRRAVDRVRSAEASGRRETTYHRQQDAEPTHDVTAQAVVDSLEASRIRAALDALTSTQRDAVELAYFGGYTHAEVAAMLDVPLGTAKTRIRDGLIRLRDALGVEIGGQR